MVHKKISKKVRDKILVDCMHRCCLCPEHQEILDIHHIVYISEDGPNTEDNLMAICPTCHAKIHRIRGRYNTKQLRIYKKQWVELCWKKDIPLEKKIAEAPSIGLEEEEISSISYKWIMIHHDLDYSDPDRILNDRCAPSIDRLCIMANKNEIYLYTKLLNAIENRWKEINHNLNVDDNIKPVTSFFLEHYRTLLNFIFDHNIFNEIYIQTIKSLERIVNDLVILENINENYKMSELIYFNNIICEYIIRLLKDKEREKNARVLINYVTTLHVNAVKNGVYTVPLQFFIDEIYDEYIRNRNYDIKYFSFQLVEICRENINQNQKNNVNLIIECILEVIEKCRDKFELYVVKDICRCVILIWIHIRYTKNTNMEDLIKAPDKFMGERDLIISFKMAFEDIERYEKRKDRVKIITDIKQKFNSS